MSDINFPAMGLAQPLLSALEGMGFSTPTPVQAQIIPKTMEGGDWMVSSQTGSGKTLAFLLPILHRLLSNSDTKLKALAGPGALILCPTRELAQQVAQDAISVLKQQRSIRVATVLGGMAFGKQIAELRGAQLVVATPGRLLDLVNQRKLTLNLVQTLVLDEADRMLDLGFSEDLEAIHSLCSQREQTLMFSATFMPRIMGLAENIMSNAQRLELAQSHETNVNIHQQLCWARDSQQKRKMLNHWLELPEMVQAIVFASTQMDTEIIARALNDDGIAAAALHGAMPQNLRNRRIKSLRDGNLKVLVATDVAARGIDVPAISHVINFGLPMKAEDYVHRIGRTGRAGREGTAVTLAEPSEKRKVAAIERYIKTRLPVANIEGFEPVNLNAAPRGKREGGGGGRPGRPQGQGFGGGFRERRDFNGDSPRPAFGEDRRPARSSFGDSPRPARNFGDSPRPAFGDDRRPARNFGDSPRPAFGEDRRPARNFGDSPRPAFGDDRRPARSFGDSPRPAFGDDRRPARSFGDSPRPAASADRRPQSEPRKEVRWGQAAPAGKPSFGDRPARTGGWSADGNTKRKVKFSGQ